MAGLVGACQWHFGAVSQHECGVDPVAVVIVEVVATVVDHQHQCLLTFRPFDIHVDGVSVSGIGDDFRTVEGFVAHNPAGVVALEQCQVAGVADV